MSHDIGETVRVRSASVRSALRGIGRAALWTAVALLLVRGSADVIAGPHGEARPAPREGLDEASAALAVRFARAYLADPSPRTLAPLLAEGASVAAGSPPRSGGAEVAQAEVVASTGLGGGQALVTVACELRGGARTLYVAVPIARSRAGEVAAAGAPSIVAAPGGAGGPPPRPRQLAGPDAAPIEALVRRFLPAYLSARSESALSYLLAPGTALAPLGGALELLEVAEVGQLDPGEGPRRTVVADARVHDPASGAVYPLAYRLELVREGRWYVEAVEGALR